MSIRLRPGGAVHVVDEGLLFCGWKSSALVTCKPGVVRVWQAVEPLLGQGVDPVELREHLPDKARPVLDTLLAELTEHTMLTTAAPAADLSPSHTHLAHFAPDLVAAWAAAGRVKIGLVGRQDLTGPVASMLSACRLPTVTPGEPGTMLVFLGDRAEFAEAAGNWRFGIAAVACGQRVLVADCATDPDRLLRAATALETGEVNDGSPTPIAWSIARTLLVERIHLALASQADDSAASLIENVTTSTVLLPAPPMAPHPLAWSELPLLAAAGDSAQMAAAVPTIPELGILLEGPEPGELVQVPVSRQQVRFGGTVHDGVGLDQERAGEDALLAATREYTGELGAAAVEGDWKIAPFAVAGRGGVDLLAEALGRVLVQLADPLTEPVEAQGLEDARATRWHQVIARLTGAPVRLRVGPAPHCPVVVLASATTDLNTAWGYGSNQDQALEHALRGLLKQTLIARAHPAEHGAQDRVAVAHEVAAGESMLRAALGEFEAVQLDTPVVAADQVERLIRRLPGLHCQLWDLGDEFELAGVVGAMVGVSR